MEDRICPECKRTFQGRADKKFCTDACRNAFNNKRNADQMNYMRTVNNALRKNRRILEGLNPDGKVKTHRDKLLNKGFNFEFFTNVYRTKAGDEYRFCYEQGYKDIGSGFLLIVKRED
jgi:hypothetical protein